MDHLNGLLEGDDGIVFAKKMNCMSPSKSFQKGPGSDVPIANKYNCQYRFLQLQCKFWTSISIKSLSQTSVTLLCAKTSLIFAIDSARSWWSSWIKEVSIQYESQSKDLAIDTYRRCKQRLKPVSDLPPWPWLQTCEIAKVCSVASQYLNFSPPESFSLMKLLVRVLRFGKRFHPKSFWCTIWNTSDHALIDLQWSYQWIYDSDFVISPRMDQLILTSNDRLGCQKFRRNVDEIS